MTSENREDIYIEKSENTSEDSDGRSVVIDIEGYYKVQVWGDPDDEFSEVMDKLEEAADRAVEDIKELREHKETSGKTYG